MPSDTSKPNKLTTKQEIFCKEYIIDFNATRAAIASGYSEKTAKVIASENLTKPYIQEYIQELTKEREKRTEITADMVVKELAKTAFIQESDFYHDSGEVKKLSELTGEQKAALSSYSFKSIHLGEGEYMDVPIFKAQDKMKALEMLGKHLGMFVDKVEHSGKLTIQRTINVNPTKAKDGN